MFHILIRVPLEDVVATSLPEVVNDSVVRAVECAMIGVVDLTASALKVTDGCFCGTGLVFSGGFRDLDSGHEVIEHVPTVFLQ